MEIRDLLKKAFNAGQEYGSNRTDENFNDFADKHKEQLMLGAVVVSEQYCPQCNNDDLFDIDDHYTKCQDCGFSFVGV